MSENVFTKGSWRAAPDKCVEDTVRDDNDFPICRLDVLYRSVDEAKANTYLVAAAPELLAACIRAIELLKGAGANVDENEPILKAIASANGQR